jgi:hypothetical protein
MASRVDNGKSLFLMKPDMVFLDSENRPVLLPRQGSQQLPRSFAAERCPDGFFWK